MSHLAHNAAPTDGYPYSGGRGQAVSRYSAVTPAGHRMEVEGESVVARVTDTRDGMLSVSVEDSGSMKALRTELHRLRCELRSTQDAARNRESEDVHRFKEQCRKQVEEQAQKVAALTGEVASKVEELEKVRQERAQSEARHAQELADLRMELLLSQRKLEEATSTVPVKPPPSPSLAVQATDSGKMQTGRSEGETLELERERSALRTRVTEAEKGRETALLARSRAIAELEKVEQALAQAREQEHAALEERSQERMLRLRAEGVSAEGNRELERRAILIRRLREDLSLLQAELSGARVTRGGMEIKNTSLALNVHAAKPAAGDGGEKSRAGVSELWNTTRESSAALQEAAQRLRHVNDEIERSANPKSKPTRDRHQPPVLEAELARSESLAEVLSSLRRDICRDAAQRSTECDETAEQCKRLRAAANAIERAVGGVVSPNAPESESGVDRLAAEVDHVLRLVPYVTRHTSGKRGRGQSSAHNAPTPTTPEGAAEAVCGCLTIGELVMLQDCTARERRRRTAGDDTPRKGIVLLAAEGVQGGG
eukprot:Hpha_TRINITY_DN33903_c0_g1::TRINITY_DN33903_c0_g1_i1::g.69495::m.69495